MGFLLAAALAAAAAVNGRLSGRIALDSASNQPPAQAPVSVRATLRLASLINLALATAAAVSFGFLVASEFSAGIRVIIGGVAFMGAATAGEWFLARQTFEAYNRLRPGQLTYGDYKVRLMATAMSVALPLGVSAILVGSLIDLVSGGAWNLDRLANLAVFLFAIALWSLQWSAIRLVLLPGKPAEFPMSDWELDAKTLALNMNTRLNDLLILRTGKSRIAGAFALGGGRIAITDDLLAVLSHDEFLAVMAHELRHFTQRKRTVRVAASIALIAGVIGAIAAWLVAAGSIAPFLAIGIATAVAALSSVPLVRIRRKNEDDADAAAVETIGADQLMSAIAKTYAVNGRLNESGSGTIHRGLHDRLLNIATLGNLGEDSVVRAIRAGSAVARTTSQVSFSR
ncbi:MAG: M48 family metalloprotease [Fimbriimonadales bacterium]|nr:M48 family metalloprotease [Fimbriimonadales bacterium]